MTVPLPTDLPYGYVDGTFLLASGDAADADRIPDGTALDVVTVTFTPVDPTHTSTTDPAALVYKDSVQCTTDANGVLTDPEGAAGVWLVAGAWIVSYSTTTAGVRLRAHQIVVTAEHDETTPLHLSLAYPPPGEELDDSEFATVMARIDNLELGVTSWDEVTDKPTAFPPTVHAGTHAIGGTDPITPGDIGAVDDDDPRLRNTGLRDLSADLINGWTGSVFLQRHGPFAVLYVEALDGSAATSNDFLPMQDGFYRYPVGKVNAFPLADSVSGSVRAIGLGGNGGSFSTDRTTIGAGGIYGQGSFFVDGSAYPAEPYPGTPA